MKGYYFFSLVQLALLYAPDYLSEMALILVTWALLCHDQSNSKRKSFIWLLLPWQNLPLREVRTGTMQKPGDRNWSRDNQGMPLTSLFFIRCLTWFLIKPRINCPGLAWSTVCVTLSQSIINQHPPPPRHAHRLIWQRQFLNWRSIFPSGSSLCQVDKN